MQTFGFPSLRDEGISMSADAQLLVSWSQHFIGAGSLHIWRPSLGKRWNLGGTHQWVYKAILSPDGERGAAICGDKQIRIWSLSEPLQSPPVYIQPVATLGYCTEARSPLAFSPDGDLLATVGEDHLIHVWNMRNHIHVLTLEGKKHEATSLAWSVKKGLLAAGGAEGSVHVWQISDGQVYCVYQDLRGRPLSLAFNANGERLGAASSEGEMRVW